MENVENRDNARIERLKEKARAWSKRFDDALEELRGDPNASREKLLDIIWEKGILDRLCPGDAEERQARQELNKELWEGDRDDAGLYWRIFYSAANAKETVKRRWTMAGGGFSSGAIFKGVLSTQTRWKDFSPEAFSAENADAPFMIISDGVMGRAKVELQKRGIKPHDNPIPWGAKGMYKGIEVEIDRYTDKGLVWLKLVHHKDMAKFFELIPSGGGVAPEELDPDDFRVEK